MSAKFGIDFPQKNVPLPEIVNVPEPEPVPEFVNVPVPEPEPEKSGRAGDKN
jgi:hypothetical protein